VADRPSAQAEGSDGFQVNRRRDRADQNLFSIDRIGPKDFIPFGKQNLAFIDPLDHEAVKLWAGFYLPFGSH
jgi:hypothetical protein